jgi:hypothetical protein
MGRRCRPPAPSLILMTTGLPELPDRYRVCRFYVKRLMC